MRSALQNGESFKTLADRAFCLESANAYITSKDKHTKQTIAPTHSFQFHPSNSHFSNFYTIRPSRIFQLFHTVSKHTELSSKRFRYFQFTISRFIVVPLLYQTSIVLLSFARFPRTSIGFSTSQIKIETEICRLELLAIIRSISLSRSNGTEFSLALLNAN